MLKEIGVEFVPIPLESDGIDVDALAAKLQQEGAASFVKSWNDMMAVIASKCAALQKVG